MTIRPDPAIYEGVEAEWPHHDQQGFPSSVSPVFGHVLEMVKPKAIIEVGCWKGLSTCRWANLAGPDSVVYAVDTWLGGYDQLKADVPYAIPRVRGIPALYLQFLSNVKRNGFEKQIVPIPNTSAHAARLLKQAGISADVVYIDGSHEYRDVCNDLEDYWPMVRKGGAMLIDDTRDFFPVYAAVVRFLAEQGLREHASWPDDGRFALIRKPA